MSFYTNIIHYYDQLFPLDQKKLDFVLSTESPVPQKILDIGCATGALCHALYHEGHQSSELILTKPLLRRQKAKTLRDHTLKLLICYTLMAILRIVFLTRSYVLTIHLLTYLMKWL